MVQLSELLQGIWFGGQIMRNKELTPRQQEKQGAGSQGAGNLWRNCLKMEGYSAVR